MSCRRTLISLPAVLVAVALVWACGGDSAAAPVEPPPRPMTVTVSPSTAELTTLGATVQLTAETFDENGHVVAGAGFSWESSDAAVATVDASGLVTAVRGGNATITATYEENTAESVISVWISTLSKRSVRVLYVVPADREFRDDYSHGMSKVIVDVQSWYRQQLDSLTFDIYSVIPEQCHLPEGEDYYSHGNVWKKVLTDVQSCAPVRGYISRFTWALYVDAKERPGEPHELGRGGPGLAMMARKDLKGLSNPGSRTYGRWVGGTAHELGHTFGLPHPPGCNDGLPTCDRRALMWTGYVKYPNTYLRDDEKAILRRSPFIKAPVPVGVEEDGLPDTFALDQNYPNPFNPSTDITFSLNELSDVKLVIYNILGQAVRELASGSLTAGSYKYRWDGRNDVGLAVTSGLYIYTLSTGSRSVSRKMILVK